MRRTEQAQGLRLMKFEEVYGRTLRGELSQAEAGEIPGMSDRTFRRWRDRFEADGAEGLYDRRLGRVSARRARCGGRGDGVLLGRAVGVHPRDRRRDGGGGRHARGGRGKVPTMSARLRGRRAPSGILLVPPSPPEDRLRFV